MMMEPMPPITTTANTTMMRFCPISGVTWYQRGQHTGESCQGGTEGVGQGDHHQRHVDAEGLQPDAGFPYRRAGRNAERFSITYQVATHTVIEATTTQAR